MCSPAIAKLLFQNYVCTSAYVKTCVCMYMCIVHTCALLTSVLHPHTRHTGTHICMYVRKHARVCMHSFAHKQGHNRKQTFGHFHMYSIYVHILQYMCSQDLDPWWTICGVCIWNALYLNIHTNDERILLV